MNEITRQLLVISFVVLSSISFVTRISFAGDDVGGNNEVFEECLKLAKQGDADEQLMLGQMYYEGALGAPQDYKEAVKWWQKAAELGVALAQLNLGHMYINGLVAQDYKEAVKWYRKAAEQGLVLAQFKLGQMYYKGIGVPQDYVESYAWLNISATQGNENASKVRDAVAKKLSSKALAKAKKLSKEYYKKYVEPFQ